MKRITIDPVTRIEGHAKITLQLDDSGRGCRRAAAGNPAPRIREIRRGPTLLRDAGHYLAHLRHLPDQPSAGIVEGLRRHHGCPRTPGGKLLRELIHCAQIFQSHALSFFIFRRPTFS